MPLGVLTFTDPLKSSQNSKQPTQKLSMAGKTMPLLVHEANHSQGPWRVRSSPTSPYLGLNESIFLYFCVCFFFLRKPKFQNCRLYLSGISRVTELMGSLCIVRGFIVMTYSL